MGRYGVPPGLILVIHGEAEQLSIQENEQPEQELFAANEKMFFSKMADDEFMFETDSTGHVTQMVLRTGGKEIPTKRID